jgi:hypothetical protein
MDFFVAKTLRHLKSNKLTLHCQCTLAAPSGSPVPRSPIFLQPDLSAHQSSGHGRELRPPLALAVRLINIFQSRGQKNEKGKSKINAEVES